MKFLVVVIFQVYDSDGNGKVSFKDIMEVLRDLSGTFMSDEQREVCIDIPSRHPPYKGDSTTLPIHKIHQGFTFLEQ